MFRALAKQEIHALGIVTLQPEIENRLSGFLDARVEATRALGPEVLALTREIRRLTLLGGKRLRSALVVTGFRSAFCCRRSTRTINS
jgi:hypothetical protein